MWVLKWSSVELQFCCFDTSSYLNAYVQAPPVRKVAEQAGQAFIEMLCPYTTRLVLPYLFACFDGRRNWQVRGSTASTFLCLMFTSNGMQLIYLC